MVVWLQSLYSLVITTMKNPLVKSTGQNGFASLYFEHFEKFAANEVLQDAVADVPIDN